jgi:CDGSH-type Zn-finger protein
VIDGGPLLVDGAPLARVVKRDSAPDGPQRWTPEPVEGVGDTYALCRCGRSGAKPFCDRWPDRLPCFDEPPALPDATPVFTWRPPDGFDGPLLALKSNGPLRVSGGVPIEREDGSLVDLGEHVSLCRCGHSAAMPFCDSSHKIVGFRDD